MYFLTGRIKKARKNFQTLLLFVNLVLLFILPSYFFEINVTVYAWMIVGVFTMGIFIAIRCSLVNHLYYFTFFLFVYIAIYFIQTSIGVKFILGYTSVSAVTPTIFYFFLIHVLTLLLPALLPNQEKPVRFYEITRNSCFIVTLGVALYTLFIVTVVDPSAFLSSRQEQYVAGGQGNVARITIYIGKILPYFVLIYIFQKASQVQQRGVYYLLFILMLIFAVVVANPGNTPRYISLSSLSMLAVYIISTIGSMRRLATLVVISPVIFLLLLPLSSLIRIGVNLSGIVGLDLSYYTTLEFSSFQVLLDAFNVEADLSSSIYSLSALLIFVPRAIWPNKSEGIGDEIATASGYPFTNVGVTPAFNMFADYGWIGLVVFSLLIGLFMRKAVLYDGMSFRNRSAFYSVLFFSQIPMLVRGDLSTYMIAMYSFTVSYEGVLLLSRLRIKRFGSKSSSATTGENTKKSVSTIA